MKSTTIAYISILILAVLAIGDNGIAKAAQAFPSLAGAIIALLVAGAGKKLEDSGFIG
ncbi:MAG: hypothetical protein KJZ92_14490 [Rhodocyclaceae bacterium]|nr:hypothetical protein [Rhodocyclaceae bacterium]